LYLRLRDDPETVQTLTLAITPMTSGVPSPTAVKPATAPASEHVPTTEQQNAQTPAPPPSKTDP
jgi:hypothetical protein